MKKLLFFLTAISLIAWLACNKEDASIDKPSLVTTRGCNSGDNYIHFHHYIASCRSACERGIGLRCGGWYSHCNNGVLQYAFAQGNCYNSVGGNYGSYDYDEVPTVHPDSPRVFEMKLQLLTSTTARVIFLEQLPQEDLTEYRYLEIENDRIRWDHPGYQFSGVGQVYSYFQILEGDYYINPSASTFGTAIVNIHSY